MIFILFQYISSKIFTNQALWKHFNVRIMIFFTLWILFAFSIGCGKNRTHVYASIWLEDSFGSFLGWGHTALVENNHCFWVQSPVAQHWLPEELPTAPSFTLQSTYLSHGYFPLTSRKISTVRYKTQVKRKSWFWEFCDTRKEGTEDTER